ncbi:Tn3 family transposase [Burkholderia paludis]|uniref:Tn3 family transposase n=1 Tax=Burkholderia paludis TaxID=1506587 RepID=UPI0038992E9B
MAPWNTVDFERAIQPMRARGTAPDIALLPYLSPLGREHINLAGNYIWKHGQKLHSGKFRSLRPLPEARQGQCAIAPLF